MNNLLSSLCGFLVGIIFVCLIGVGVSQQHDYPAEIRDLKQQHDRDSIRYTNAKTQLDTYNLKTIRAQEHIKSLVEKKRNSRK